MDAYEAGDHERVLATLADDVEWVIHGHRTTLGKAAFLDEINNPGFSGNPELTIERTFEDGDTVISTGVGRGTSVEHGAFAFAFNDIFTFRDGLIARLDSYIVPLG
jgi:ketosteroid isomerase-like protein